MPSEQQMQAIQGALVGAVVTIGIFVTGVIFRMGHQTARIEQLEKWRDSIRLDMHEISDKLSIVGEELKRLGTLIEERTHRVRHSDQDAR
jgi:hypothetical protein